MKFEGVKLNDSLLVTVSSGFGGVSYHEGKVIHVTKTRFILMMDGREKTFTKDGNEYPRQTDYSRTYCQLEFLNDEGRSKILKHKLAWEAKNLAHKLTDIFGNSNYRERILSNQLPEEELIENIATLKNVYEKFKKYGPKKD